MNSKQRLEEIEYKFRNPSYEYESEHTILDNANWLIARVKILTAALEEVQKACFSDNNRSRIAKEALESEE